MKEYSKIETEIPILQDITGIREKDTGVANNSLCKKDYHGHRLQCFYVLQLRMKNIKSLQPMPVTHASICTVAGCDPYSQPRDGRNFEATL